MTYSAASRPSADMMCCEWYAKNVITLRNQPIYSIVLLMPAFAVCSYFTDSQKDYISNLRREPR